MHSLDLQQIRLQHKLRTLNEMIISLEEYQSMIRGGVSKQAAIAVAQDVLRITKYMGFRDAPALEAHAELSNAMSHALGMENSESIGARIRAAIAKFKEWLIQMYNTIKDQIGAMMVSFTKMRERIEVLKGSLKGMSDNTQTEVHIPAKLAQQVSIQGDMDDGHFPALLKVAQFGSTTYPDAINEFFLELASVVKMFNPTEPAESMVQAIQESLAPLNFANVDTATYPGNVMITPDESGYNYTIAQVEARIVDADVTRPVRDSATIQRDLVEILRVIEQAEKIQGTSTNIETSVNKVVEATDELSKKAADETQESNVSQLVRTVLANTSKVNNSSANIIRYLGRVLNAHLQIIEHEIRVATTAQRA